MLQDALCITGSIRLNFNPFFHIQDIDIIIALTKAHLWSIFKERDGLDAECPPDTLSKVQQQLLALARALLQKGDRNGGVVLLDEATSVSAERCSQRGI